MSKVNGIKSCLKEEGWKLEDVIRISVNDRPNDYKVGDRYFTRMLNYLNSNKIKINGILVGYSASRFGEYSNSIEVWANKRIYTLYRKIA